MKKHNKKGKVLISAGTLLIVAAVFLVVFNIITFKKAELTSKKMLAALDLPEVTEEVPDYILNPEKEMPEKEVDGILCVATVEIPSIGIKLPVASEWSYPNLQKCPCRYVGTVYLNSLIIAAHNYPEHFGKIAKLQNGDAVIVTDIDGNVFKYSVDVVDVLEPTAIEEMKAGRWDLTLFTCTIGGSYRVTVRCNRIKGD